MKDEREILEEDTKAKTAIPENDAASVEKTAAVSATAEDEIILTTSEVAEENAVGSPIKPTKLQQFLQLLKFTVFMASAGVIQLLSTTALHQWTGWLADYYWIAYVIGLTLSVIWSFTFNRKFTFKAANNVPLAMVLVIIYNCLIVIPLAWGGDELVKIWGTDLGIVVTVITMLINFVTEFFWDKFIVFNAKVTDKMLSWFKKKDK